MGMHTTVMENGQGLSGGQCQRLAIARALVARPKIVLFDEATSALDNRTQDIVGRSLAEIAATRVVIAHRLSTIVRADRIVVMDEGRLVQNGSFDALMTEPGKFSELAARQLL
jgi:ATP-binding cassette subfamily C protein